MSNEGRPSQAGSILSRVALAAASLLLSLAATEIAWRLILGSETDLGHRLRDPALYADPLSDDLFWLLRHRWQKDRFQPPKNPHPVLGWRAAHIGADYSHREEERIGDRRPVLLYGDSFAQGMAGVERFQKILNRNPDFSRDHYLLNYGVGGYGLDQIYLLLRHSIDRFEDPYVIFSFLTYDLDRSVLSVRVGQKPYFEIEDDELVLKGLPIESRPEDFFAARPAQVGSYLLRRLSRLPAIRRWQDEAPERQAKQRINGALLDAALRELQDRQLDYTILVFHTRQPFRQAPDWRFTWLRSELDRRGEDDLWTYDLLRPLAAQRPLDDLFDPGHHHPTTLANRIVARAIARRVLGASAAPTPHTSG